MHFFLLCLIQYTHKKKKECVKIDGIPQVSPSRDHKSDSTSNVKRESHTLFVEAF